MEPIDFIVKNQNKNLILFVHGFTSDSSTWTNPNGVSFPEMLCEEEFIKDNFDMAYFNYFTQLSDFKKARSSVTLVSKLFGCSIKAKKNIGLKKLSDFLKSVIDVFCTEYKNIVLVSHSMGGLISKAYILNELEENSSTKIKLFLSIAVPHNGSNWANIGSALIKRNPQLVDLKPLSDFLNEINNDWIHVNEGIPKTIYYYGQFDDVVDETSAISYQAVKQHKISCNDDHFSITKPDTKNSIIYQGIRKNLDEFIKDLQSQKDIKPQLYVDDGKFDDEIFVLKLLIADVHNIVVKNAKETFFNAEYMKKELISRGYSLEHISDVYRKIEKLYIIYFMKFMHDEIESSDQLVATIYEQIIERDREFLQTSISLIDAEKKTGMLHQLANNLERDIWWAKNNSIKDIEEFRKARDSNEG
jgi:pimeloyl-ACP methyl ester carboxylesterase